MISNEDLSTEDMKEFWLNVEENRLKTFKDWPFTENCTCTPERMAAAGFYHCPTENEPDLVKCVICGKELDGWEPTDDPWSEHVSHSVQCPFVLLKAPKWNEMTVKQFCELELSRWLFLSTKEMDTKIAEVEAYMETARQELISLKDSI